MRKIIDIVTHEDCPYAEIWYDALTHEKSNVVCLWNGDNRNDDDRRCQLPGCCPLEDAE